VSALDRVLERAHAQPHGTGWTAHCPGPLHRRGDRKESLSIDVGDDGRVLVHCFANCPTEQVVAAWGLTMVDLFDHPETSNGKRRRVATYDYTEEAGQLLFQVHRYSPKDFLQQAANGDWTTKGIRKPLYRLPDVLRAKELGQPIVVCEGEKDAEAVNSLGTELGIATTNPEGAGKWRPEHADTLDGATRVVVIADDDPAGHQHAAKVADSLARRVGDVRVFLPAVGCNDVSDHLNAGHPLKALRPIAEADWRQWLKADQTAEPTLASQKASSVTPVRTKWLWPGWLPAGKLVTFDGDPDVGKSTVTIDITARVTTGASMPDGSKGLDDGADVILLAAEDDLEDTISWRLMAAGADLDRVHYVNGIINGDGEEDPFTMPVNLPLLEAKVRETKAALVVIDVLDEYLSESVDSFKNQSVRRVMHQLRKVCERTGVTILMLRHFRKEGGKAIYRGGGSIGIVGAARAGWAVAYHPDDESLRVMAAVKMNLALKPSAQAFKLTQHDDYPCASVDWRGAVDISADHLLETPAPTPTDEQADNRSKIEQCIDALKQILEEPGDHWSNDVLEELRREGFKASTIDTGRARGPFDALRRKRPDESWGWKIVRLPDDPET
jgi:putative DNA primase/helicase